MKKLFSWKVLLPLAVVAVAAWVVIGRIDFTKPVDLEHYEPSPEVAPAYEALSTAEATDASIEGDGPSDDGGADYDIEQTVRIMNSLEVAQAQSDSFEEFLEYMARQDYRGVARDVLAVKRQLFPVLDEMNRLRREERECATVWSCLRGASRHVADEIEQDGGGASDYVLAICLGGELSVMKTGIDAAFTAYQEQQDLKRRIESRLNRLRRQYIAYVESYMPVYYKYMDEWNALCLDKDRAYINLYAGKVSDALQSAQRVLARHPTNREGLLLKAVALLRMGHEQGAVRAVSSEEMADFGRWVAEKPMGYDVRLKNPCYFAARSTLDRYTELYPDRAAPALLLYGMLEERLGDDRRAEACYEQAATEYPRQAEALADLLDSYVSRTYLTQSVEGRYLLNYYRATMEGAGIFSPNLRKAALFARQGEMEKSREEIYKHFFRRGSQAVQHSLLSDMQYCEEYLYGSFKPMLLEQSYIDLDYSVSAKFMGMGRKENQLDIRLVNRSDVRLENVRVFLCIHTVGMYRDDYDVVRMAQTRNVVKPYEEVRFDGVSIAPRKADDVTRIRAIVMTDDKICWLDSRDVKRQIATEGARRALDGSAESRIATRRERFMRDLSMTSPGLCRMIRERTKVSREGEGWFSAGKLHVRLPRVAALLSPWYTIHPIEETERTITPTENRLVGDYIELTFDGEVDERAELYLYSEIISFRIPLEQAADGAYAIGEVREI